MPSSYCSEQALVTDAARYTRSIISSAQQQALIIYAKALELAARGGTDYTESLTDDLLIAAAEKESIVEEAEAAYVNLAFAKASAAGAEVPATLDEKLEAIKGLVYASSTALKMAELAIDCELTVL